jgi:hypothetical protein
MNSDFPNGSISKISYLNQNFSLYSLSLSNELKNKFNTQIMFAIKETLLYIFIKAWFFTAYMIILKLKIFVVDRIIMHFDHK